MTDRPGQTDPLWHAAADDLAVERLLKRDARSTVELVRLGERRYVRKTYHLPALKRWAYGWVGRTPARREQSNARRLAGIGVRVPEPIRLVRGALVMPCIEGPSLHEFIATCDDPGKRLAVARAVGRQMKWIVEAGLANRDHKARNLIVDAACVERGEQPVLIDPMGLRRATPDRITRMTARLIETARKAGPVSRREMLTCYHASRSGHSPRDVRQRWLAELDAALRRMGKDPL